MCSIREFRIIAIKFNNRTGNTVIAALAPKHLVIALTAALGFATSAFYLTSRATPPEPIADQSEPALTEASVPHYIKAAEIIAYGRPQRLLSLRSDAALVLDEREDVVLYGRRVDTPKPIASLTKLMTALVLLDSGLDLNEPIEVTREDRDRLRGSRSRLPYGTVATRHELLLAALGASDNRAAAALARTYPGGTPVFVAAMNAKAKALGMSKSRFADASGLHSGNVASVRDLAKLVAAASASPLISTLSTTSDFDLTDQKTGRRLEFRNTNRLVRRGSWDIALSKTGYTADAGNCLVMQATINGRPLTLVLLDSWGKLSKYGDAERVREWLLKTERRVPLISVSDQQS